MDTVQENVQAAKAAPPEAASKVRQRTVLDVFGDRVAASGGEVALRRKQGTTWRASTWSDWDRVSREVAGGLLSLGIETGDRVAILAQTRAEWVEADIGVLMAGAITVPIYPSNTPAQCEYVLRDSAARFVFVEDPAQLEKLFDDGVNGKLEAVEKVILFADTAVLDPPDQAGRTRVALAEVLPDDKKDLVMSWEALREAGRAHNAEHPEALTEIKNVLDPGQAATFVYTSGTTGDPKGVVLPHKNVAFICESVKDLIEVTDADEQVLFLPLAHVFAKLMVWISIQVGARTAFAESIPKLVSNMQEVKPTFLAAVPRVYEKAYAKILANFEEKRKSPVTRILIDWALVQGKRRAQLLQAGKEADGLAIKLADKLVFSKVRDTFGGRIRFFASGGAPLSADIAELFLGAGIFVLEGYGLTETTAVTNINRPAKFKLGTVGPAIPGVELKIADDGEILMRGDNIMKEYFGKPEATREAIDADGWFHSGDVGEIEPGGFLRITDRKKDIIVTAGGKNVAPQNIENAFKALCPYASQMMVYGDKKKFLTALITLNEEAVAAWAKEQGIATDDLAELSEHPKVKALIDDHIQQLNRDLASYESIKKYVILPKDFDQESGELTPTLKVRRKFCSEKYRDVLEGLYE